MVRIGVGLNTGIACVGNMGSEKRFNYSAMGDVVNVAARIEGLCKEVGADILASESVGPGRARNRLARGRFSSRCAGGRAIPGFSSWSATRRWPPAANSPRCAPSMKPARRSPGARPSRRFRIRASARRALPQRGGERALVEVVEFAADRHAVGEAGHPTPRGASRSVT